MRRPAGFFLLIPRFPTRRRFPNKTHFPQGVGAQSSPGFFHGRSRHQTSTPPKKKDEDELPLVPLLRRSIAGRAVKQGEAECLRRGDLRRPESLEPVERERGGRKEGDLLHSERDEPVRILISM